ncbi:FadR/GntR family transcriptional regulator [Streptomyces brasiliensis]|uniref:GntR family transcriptional regulator n=1 Tax=Streptomyces brasiliensis TaxID=1954 RepID=A0A917P5R0_9ACTN|nr:FCD domain-containing protein [Streptomyces brasiliensis]GGJ62874.1 GntR family transcriptional regulator [Streptomyces brasiliensis]
MSELGAVRVGSLQPPRLPKMAELIANQLRRQIVRGQLAEGEALPSEAELLERFGVSRPTLREALRVLESESLITVRRGAHGGARVQVPNIDVAARYAGFVLEHRGTTLADVYEARILLEPPIVGLLAGRRTDQDVQRLRAALEEHEATAHVPMVAIRTHTAFHALLVELTGNQTLRVLTGMVQHIIDRANLEWVESKVATPEETGMSLGLRAHHRVVDLIEAGVQSGAEEVWRKHLTEARDYLLRPDVTTVLDLMS